MISLALLPLCLLPSHCRYTACLMFRSDAYLRCTGLIIEVTLTDRQQKRVPVMPHTRARSRCAGAESVLRAMHDPQTIAHPAQHFQIASRGCQPQVIMSHVDDCSPPDIHETKPSPASPEQPSTPTRCLGRTMNMSFGMLKPMAHHQPRSLCTLSGQYSPKCSCGRFVRVGENMQEGYGRAPELRKCSGLAVYDILTALRAVSEPRSK